MAPLALLPDADLVRSYLRDIGRVPLLSHQQEITLGRQVQVLMEFEALEAELKDQQGGEAVSRDEVAKAAGVSSAQLKRKLQAGRRAKERMVAANLRLVVSVAKKYTKRNMELLDLIQEGTVWCVESRNLTPLGAISSAPMRIGGFVRASRVRLRRRAERFACRFTSQRC